MKLRVRAPSGQHTLEADPTTAVGLFKFMLEAEVGLPADEIVLLAGFPPRQIVHEDSDTLEALGIKGGDQLIVQLEGHGGGNKQGHTKGGKYIPPAPENGSFTKRTVPGDNSCLFHTAAYVLENRSRSLGPSLRTKIAEVVAAHPQKFTSVYLGRPNLDYCSWIQEPDSWGGAIELAILSFMYTTEIVALDVSTCRMDRYGEGEGYSTVVYVCYTGKHYDAMTMARYGGCQSEKDDVVMFNTNDEKVLKKAQDFITSEAQKAMSGRA